MTRRFMDNVGLSVAVIILFASLAVVTIVMAVTLPFAILFKDSQVVRRMGNMA